MAPSIARRLLHPRVAIEQGLPTSSHRYGMRAGEAAPVIGDESKGRMTSYLNAVPLHHSTPHTLAQQEHLYSALSIIDTKAQALLSFNSFLLAIVGIYFGTIQSVQDQILILIPFLTTVVASGTSCLLCLDVIWVHWMTETDMTAEADVVQGDVADGFLQLLMLRDERTRTYRISWLLSFTSVSAVVAGVIVAIVTDVA